MPAWRPVHEVSIPYRLVAFLGHAALALICAALAALLLASSIALVLEAGGLVRLGLGPEMGATSAAGRIGVAVGLLLGFLLVAGSVRESALDLCFPTREHVGPVDHLELDWDLRSDARHDFLLLRSGGQEWELPPALHGRLRVGSTVRVRYLNGSRTVRSICVRGDDPA